MQTYRFIGKAYVAENIFQREERDWGFQHFLSPAELSPGIGFIEDDKLVVEAEAFVLSSYDGSDIRKWYTPLHVVLLSVTAMTPKLKLVMLVLKIKVLPAI